MRDFDFNSLPFLAEWLSLSPHKKADAGLKSGPMANIAMVRAIKDLSASGSTFTFTAAVTTACTSATAVFLSAAMQLRVRPRVRGFSHYSVMWQHVAVCPILRRISQRHRGQKSDVEEFVLTEKHQCLSTLRIKCQ